MTVYFDNEFKCYTKPADGLSAAETDFFDGKCEAFIEGYKLVPEGSAYAGKVSTGQMIFPWKPYSELEAAQRGYEEAMVEADGHIAALVDEIYNMELEGIYNV